MCMFSNSQYEYIGPPHCVHYWVWIAKQIWIHSATSSKYVSLWCLCFDPHPITHQSNIGCPITKSNQITLAYFMWPFKEKENLQYDNLSCWLPNLIIKLEMTISVIHNCSPDATTSDPIQRPQSFCEVGCAHIPYIQFSWQWFDYFSCRVQGDRQCGPFHSIIS